MPEVGEGEKAGRNNKPQPPFPVSKQQDTLTENKPNVGHYAKLFPHSWYPKIAPPLWRISSRDFFPHGIQTHSILPPAHKT
jgi:hypothetical protein